jgi:hypothetical protein
MLRGCYREFMICVLTNPAGAFTSESPLPNIVSILNVCIAAGESL